MKKVYSKICNSKLLFTVFILTCFILFDFLTTGLGIWGGLVEKLSIVFNNIYSYTYYGKEFISEMIWLLLLIPVVIIFKNKYIFRQKRMKLLPSLLIAWPFVLYTLIAMIRSFVSVNISRINIYEIIALVLFTLTIGLFEEIMCRGWLQNEFIERFGHDRKGVIYSIIVSGTIFGLMHITNLFFGQDLFNTVIQVISASVTGIAFGAIYHRTKNIWSVIVLHGVWDFAIFFAEINIATSCVTASSSIDVITPVLGILAVILSIFTSLPELFIALTLMSKSSINLGLDENYRIALTDEQIKADKSKEKVFSIITGCLLFIYAIGVLIWGGAVSDTCPNYILKDVSNYSEVLLNYDNYDLIVEKYKTIQESDSLLDSYEGLQNSFYCLNFRIDENNLLVITNIYTNQRIILKYNNVINFAIFENFDTYNIIILSSENNGNLITYHSDFITNNGVSNDFSYLESFSNSFKQVMVPANVNKIGYYQEKNDSQKLPLFISTSEDHYILNIDETINKY